MLFLVNAKFEDTLYLINLFLKIPIKIATISNYFDYVELILIGSLRLLDSERTNVFTQEFCLNLNHLFPRKVYTFLHSSHDNHYQHHLGPGMEVVHSVTPIADRFSTIIKILMG